VNQSIILTNAAAAQIGSRNRTAQVYDIDIALGVRRLAGSMRRLAVFLLAYIVSAAGIAASLAPAVSNEIDALMARLESSSCAFNRNGSWHTAAEAVAHLKDKLQYLEERNMVKTTEQFIELAASKSSMTGAPYLVRCANEAPVQSANWLSLQLRAIRSAAPAGK
jgi:hypothetical protein